MNDAALAECSSLPDSGKMVQYIDRVLLPEARSIPDMSGVVGACVNDVREALAIDDVDAAKKKASEIIALCQKGCKDRSAGAIAVRAERSVCVANGAHSPEILVRMVCGFAKEVLKMGVLELKNDLLYATWSAENTSKGSVMACILEVFGDFPMGTKLSFREIAELVHAKTGRLYTRENLHTTLVNFAGSLEGNEFGMTITSEKRGRGSLVHLISIDKKDFTKHSEEELKLRKWSSDLFAMNARRDGTFKLLKATTNAGLGNVVNVEDLGKLFNVTREQFIDDSGQVDEVAFQKEMERVIFNKLRSVVTISEGSVGEFTIRKIWNNNGGRRKISGYTVLDRASSVGEWIDSLIKGRPLLLRSALEELSKEPFGTKLSAKEIASRLSAQGIPTDNKAVISAFRHCGNDRGIEEMTHGSFYEVHSELTPNDKAPGGTTTEKMFWIAK